MKSFQIMRLLLKYGSHTSLKWEEYVFLYVQSTHAFTRTSTTPVGTSMGAPRFTRCEAESVLLLLCGGKGAIKRDWLQGLSGTMLSQLTCNSTKTSPK